MTTPGNPFEQPSGWGPPPQPGQYGTQPPWQGQQQTEVKAMIALGLAIAAYTPTVPFIGAIAALVLARMARRDIRASGGRLTGESLCTWAVVLSWIHLVAVALFLLVVLLFFSLPFAFSL